MTRMTNHADEIFLMFIRAVDYVCARYLIVGIKEIRRWPSKPGVWIHREDVGLKYGRYVAVRLVQDGRTFRVEGHDLNNVPLVFDRKLRPEPTGGGVEPSPLRWSSTSSITRPRSSTTQRRRIFS